MDPLEMKKNSDYWNINEIKKLTGQFTDNLAKKLQLSLPINQRIIF